MKKVCLIVVVLIGLMVVVAEAATKTFNEDFMDVNAIINIQVLALVEEDIHTYLSTYHPEAPCDKAALYDVMTMMFSNFDLDVEIEKVSFVKYVGDNELHMSVTQSTFSMKENDETFEDNTLVQTWIFKKYNHTWYFFKSVIELIAYNTER